MQSLLDTGESFLIDSLPELDLAPSPRFLRGHVVAIRGTLVEASLPGIGLDAACTIETRNGTLIRSQVVGFRDGIVSLAPLENISGISPGSQVYCADENLTINVGDQLLGRVVDCLGKVIDLRNSTELGGRVQINSSPPSPLSRRPVDEPLHTGIKTIDAFCTLGLGQRIGIMAPPGVGKSTLLGMLAKHSNTDVIVIALVGERGREVRDFLENTLGPEGRKRSVVVVATSDEMPLRRAIAPFTATAIAEYFRAQGKNVLLLVDSLTRTARALRDLSVSAGELPVRQGLTPSVYTQLPKLIERAGNDSVGTMTAIYTLLANEGGDPDPLAEEAKSLLDGHLVLSNNCAQQGIRPAIDIINSISRLASDLQTSEHRKAAEKLRIAAALVSRNKDLLLFGGTPDAELQKALNVSPRLMAFQTQDTRSAFNYDQTVRELLEIAKF